ncbi:CU044_2847 family protein [Dactylosporangium siamense]|uniref:Trypsin-co-occurring domain-containing protein n=1 Tax=Dactylosporangium siamense TaxID=685454 RepID=A0A919U9H2_9ACTN|nr:CU044_2847 family protein [Dactylosporangium siamense]GIG42643.1 hypothetical protein Dsi01nite_006840 [Dactylosporangium siamense]
MRQVLPLSLSTGGVVYVEVDDERAVVRAGTGPAEALTRAAASVTSVFNVIRDTADDALSTLQGMVSAPSRVELEFGVSITGEASAVVTKAGAGANLKVTVVWEKDGGS